jgi:Spy/CpxP family protein refolding chaperone
MRPSRNFMPFLGALLLSSASVPAQQPRQGHEHADTTEAGAMSCPLMPAMMSGPSAALHASDALSLTATQRSRLERLRQGLDSSRRAAMARMRGVHAALGALVTAPRLDDTRVRAELNAMGQLHTGMALAMLRASRETGAILTPSQRDSLAARAMNAMRAGNGKGGAMGDMSGMCTMPMSMPMSMSMSMPMSMPMPESGRRGRAMPGGGGMARPGAGGP